MEDEFGHLLPFFVLQFRVDMVVDDGFGYQVGHAVPQWNVQNIRNHQQQVTCVTQGNSYHVLILT